jgi:nitric oxide synthase-interacting protein
LAQKKELKRGEKTRQNAEKEAARIRAVGDEEDRERAIRDFEMTQAGLTNSTTSKRPISNAAAESENEEQAIVRAGSKRKFALDADELGRIAENDKARARRAIDDEKVQNKKDK